jgi:hypothetical protein
MSLVTHLMTPRRQAYIFSPLHTEFDTASRFWVLNGITRQLGARAYLMRLCREITKCHETKLEIKLLFGFSVLCSTN